MVTCRSSSVPTFERPPLKSLDQFLFQFKWGILLQEDYDYSLLIKMIATPVSSKNTENCNRSEPRKL